MANNQQSAVPGWVGGFAESNSEFTQNPPKLTALPMLDNMDNINLLERQQAVKWPEFSWLTVPKKEESRCFQMFAPDISRLGYTKEGRVYSIICPQQGIVSPTLGSLNVEVTVTGQRGWADESNRTLAADMMVEGKIWFAPSAHQKPLVKRLWDKFANSKLPFPSKKEHAIRVKTHKIDNRKQPIFPLNTGETNRFIVPEFARHENEAWAVGNLSVQIGKVAPSGNLKVNIFNRLIVRIFNKHAGNMLKKGNVLTWNVWFTPPELVDQEEWRTHAERWRESIQADHGSPDGEGTEARYSNGTLFKSGEPYPGAPRTRGDSKVKSLEELEEEEMAEIGAFLEKHF